jgi:lactose/L-arabinose transport system substrate-binding protein
MAGFNGDTIATYPCAVWLGGTIKDTTGTYGKDKAQWGVFNLPALERGGLRTSNLGGSVLVIPDQCPSKEAAWAFVEYALCTREGQVAQYANYDLFPAYLPALDDPFFQQGDPFYGGQKVRALFAAAVNGIPVLHRTPDWVEGNRYVEQKFTLWAAGGMDTGQMLRDLSVKMRRRLGRELAP